MNLPISLYLWIMVRHLLALVACSYHFPEQFQLLTGHWQAKRCGISWDLQKPDLLEIHTSNTRNNMKPQIKNKNILYYHEIISRHSASPVLWCLDFRDLSDLPNYWSNSWRRYNQKGVRWRVSGDVWGVSLVCGQVNSLARRYTLGTRGSRRALCMVSCHRRYIYGTWRSKEVGGKPQRMGGSKFSRG